MSMVSTRLFFLFRRGESAAAPGAATRAEGGGEEETQRMENIESHFLYVRSTIFNVYGLN
jgi:hypothetical protein